MMPAKYQLRLYVSRFTPEVTRVIASIKQVCDCEIEGGCSFEVVDVSTRPEEAEKHRIIATPTLVRELPLPLRRLIGDLSQIDDILEGLEFVRKKPNPSPPSTTN